MAKYRKKPVIIDAIQWHGDNIGEVQWFYKTDGILIGDQIIIDTLEGTMKANIGDWIIKGVNGEYYPCKPDIFEKTYEPV